jgi:prepilin-type N-terminal cleavage/methylation domain-containing protein
MKRHNTVAVIVDEQGFTILETLTAITIISLSALIMTGFLSSTLRLTGRVRDTLALSMDLLKADEQLRGETAAIAIPYWERRVNIVQTPSLMAIPWYGGEEGHVLELRIGGNFPHITGVNVLRDVNEIPYGLDIVYEYRGRTIYTSCCFSTLPVNTEPKL